MKKNIYLFAIFSLAAFLLAAPAITNAALIECGTGDPNAGGYDVCGWDDLLTTVDRLVQYAIFYFAIPIGVIVIIVGGFRMILSAGNEASFKKGRQMIQSVGIGLAITFGAWLIVKTILFVFFPAQG